MKHNPFRTCLVASAAGLVALTAVLPAQADYRSTVLSYNPSAYWRLNETTPVPGDFATNAGTLGAAATGLYVSGAAHPVTGIPGAGTAANTAANFPNTDHSWGRARMRVPFLPVLNQAAPFTAEFWARPDQQGTICCPYASTDFSLSTRYGWLFYQDNPAGQWFFRVYTTAGNTVVQGGAVTAGVWQHVVAVFDGTSLSLYVNGTRVAGPTAISGTFTPVTNPDIPLSIGGRGDGIGGTFGYGGDLDEVALYTNALSGTEILAHYQAGVNSATPDYSALILPNHPAGYWRLGEPAWLPPGTLPVAANAGYLGATAQGTYQPGMTTGNAGPGYSGLGGAAVSGFNSGAGYVDCGLNVPDLSTPLNQITIMLWGRFPVARTMDWESIITCGDTAWELQRPNLDYAVNFRFAGQDLNTPNTRPINDGKWHHVVATYDGSQQKIYLDGTLAASVSRTLTGAGETAYPIVIGDNGQYLGQRLFSGNLGDVAVFTNALSASDVWTIYSSSWLAPTILTAAHVSPTNYLFEGAVATLSVTAAGASPLHYQWSKGTSPISGATASSYALTTNAAIADSGTYSVVITNSSGAVTSSVVLTVVGSPPVIVTQPASISAFIGAPASFTVIDGGSLPRYYQWKYGSTPIPGATTSTLTIPNVQWGDAGSYSCTISNSYGSTNTAPATLSVGGEFVGLTLPTTGARTRHTALGSDGSNLYFTPGDTATAPFYRIPQMDLTGSWASRMSLPTPSVGTDSGIGDLCYFGGGLWCWGPDPSGTTSGRVVYRYDIGSDSWTAGALNPNTPRNDGPNSSCAVIDTTNVLGGWMGYFGVYKASDWTNGVWGEIAQLPGGAVHPWDSCIGPNAVYFIKHYNLAASNAVLASFTRTGSPAVSYISGVPFNVGMGCAIEYMPATLFSDSHDRLYILRGMTGTTDDDAGEQYGHWTTPTTTNQLAVYDLVSHTWGVQSLPWTIDVGSEMCLVNQTLYILAANGDPEPLKMLYLGTPVKPVVVSQPVSQTVYVGQAVNLSVSTFGGGPMTYQWRRDGTPVPGATRNPLVISSATYSDIGTYDVLISNSAGSTNSLTATVNVLPLPSFANLTNGLVLHLTFDTNESGVFPDFSGRGNTATVVGSPTLVPGKIGFRAMHYSTDSSNPANVIKNYATLGGPADLLFGPNQNFSVSYWIRFNGGTMDLPVFCNNNCGEGCIGFYFGPSANASGYTPGTWAWSFANSSYAGIDAEGPANAINDNQWHNVISTFDRTGLAVTYLDGVQVDSRSIASFTDTLDTANPVNVGQVGSADYNVTFGADVDDLGVWLRPLTSLEAQSVYIVGQQGTTFDVVAPVSLTIRKTSTGIQLIWQSGQLLSSPNVNAPVNSWTPVSGATAPFYNVTPGPTPTFYRVKVAGP